MKHLLPFVIAAALVLCALLVPQSPALAQEEDALKIHTGFYSLLGDRFWIELTQLVSEDKQDYVFRDETQEGGRYWVAQSSRLLWGTKVLGEDTDPLDTNDLRFDADKAGTYVVEGTWTLREKQGDAYVPVDGVEPVVRRTEVTVTPFALGESSIQGVEAHYQQGETISFTVLPASEVPEGEHPQNLDARRAPVYAFLMPADYEMRVPSYVEGDDINAVEVEWFTNALLREEFTTNSMDLAIGEDIPDGVYTLYVYLGTELWSDAYEWKGFCGTGDCGELLSVDLAIGNAVLPTPTPVPGATPETGDDFNAFLLLGGMFAAAVGLAAVGLKRRKESR